MDPLGLIKALKKLYAFLVGLMPVAALLAPLERAGRWVAGRPLVQALGSRLGESRPVRAAAVVIRRFVWRDHSGDQVDLSALPPTIAPVLRIGLSFVAVGLLLILVVRIWPWPPLTVAGIEGIYVEQLSYFTIYLLICGVSLGWGLLLAGAARTNIVTMLLSVVVFLYLALPMMGAAGVKAHFGLLSLALFWLVGQASPTVLDRPAKRLVLGLFIGLALGGTLSRGLYLSRLPLGLGLLIVPLCIGVLVGLLRRDGQPRGAILRTILGLFALAVAGRALLLVPMLWEGGSGRPLLHQATDLGVQIAVMALCGHLALTRWRGQESARLSRMVLLMSLAMGLFLVVTLVQIGHAPMLARLHLHLGAFDGYLWIIWYFIGVGIIFKLLNETRTLAQALDLLLPGRSLPVIGLGLLALLLLVGFFEEGVLLLGRVLPDEPRLVVAYRLWLRLGRSPAWFETLLIMRWIGLVGLGVLLYLRTRRLLDRERALRVGYLLLLALLVVYEYHFEFYAFGKAGSGGQRLLAPFFFGVWIVWLCYSVGMRAASGSSPRFSREGRTGLFCGGFVLVISVIHLQATAAPALMADRLFLQLFMGLMHVGLPYFLYVYLGKRFDRSQVPTLRLLGGFVLGILAQVPVLLFGKLAMGGFSVEGFLNLAVQMREAMLRDGSLPEDLSLPTSAAFLVGTLVLGTALRLGALAVLRGTRDPLSAIAVYTGFGSAAVMPLALPLFPPSLLALLSPVPRQVFLTLELANHHALHLGLALILATAIRSGPGGLIRGTLLAALLELSVTWLLAAHGDLLAASGLSWLLLLGLAGLDALLFVALERRLRQDLYPDQTVAAPLLPARHLGFLGLMVGLPALGFGVSAYLQEALIPMRISGPGVQLSLGIAASWERLALPGTLAAWKHDHPAGRALLMVQSEAFPEGQGLRDFLVKRDSELKQTLSGYAIVDQTLGAASAWRWFRLQAPGADGQMQAREGEMTLVRQGSRLVTLICVADRGAAFRLRKPQCRRMLSSVEVP